METQLDLRQLAQEYGTPCYVFNGATIRAQYNTLHNAFGGRADIFFSVKSNSNINIAKLLRSFGSSIEVASMGELLLARQAGFPPEDIIFSGPGKTMQELTEAVAQNLLCIMAESLEEVARVQQIAAGLGVVANVGVRVNPNFKPPKTALVMGGEKQFGIDENEIDAVVAAIQNMQNVRLMGIHIYTGTQVLDNARMVQYFRDVQQTVAGIAQRNKLHFALVDTGGGMGISYANPEDKLDLDAVSPQLCEIMQGYADMFPGCRIAVESGRFLLAQSGTYVSTIQYKKAIKGNTYLVVDGGLNHCSLASFQGKLYRRNPPISILPQNDKCRPQNTIETVSIVGPLCTPDDLLGNQMELPVAEQGDLVCIHRVGAYGLSYSPMQFLGHESPVEVLVNNGAVHIIRARGHAEDILLNQNLDVQFDEV